MLAMKTFSALALALAFVSSVGAASAQPVYAPYQQPQVLPPPLLQTQPSAQPLQPTPQPPPAHHVQQPPQPQAQQPHHPPAPHVQQPQVQAPRHPQPHVQQPQQPRPPAVGDRPREARPVHHADSARFRAPPRGQEYRVVDGYVVLVDSRSLQIVNVLGLLSTLIR